MGTHDIKLQTTHIKSSNQLFVPLCKGTVMWEDDDDYEDGDEELHIIALTEMHMHTMSGDCHCRPEKIDNNYIHRILSFMRASEFLTEIVPINEN